MTIGKKPSAGVALLLGSTSSEKPEKGGGKRGPSKMAQAAAKDLLGALESKDEGKVARVLDAMLGGGGGED